VNPFFANFKTLKVTGHSPVTEMLLLLKLLSKILCLRQTGIFLINDYFAKTYGSAGNYMQNFFMTIEDSVLRASNWIPDVNTSDTTTPDRRVYTPSVLSSLKSSLSNAKNAATGNYRALKMIEYSEENLDWINKNLLTVGERIGNKLENPGAESGDMWKWKGFDNISSNLVTSGLYSFEIAGYAQIKYMNLVPIEPGKDYFLKAWFRSQGIGHSRVFFGFDQYDKDLNKIQSHNVNPVNGTETVLTREVKADAWKIYVSDASNWSAGSNYGVAFDIDDSGSYNDLPNFAVTMWIDKVNNLGNGEWSVELKRAVPFDYPANTKVRLHTYGPSSNYVASNQEIYMGWTASYGVISGYLNNNVYPTGKWWKGTEYVRPIILANYNQSEEYKLLADDFELYAIDSQPVTSQNLIPNGNAELGNFQNWINFDSINSNDKRSGNYSFQADGYKHISSQEPVYVHPDGTYSLSGYFKSIGTLKSKVFLGFVPLDISGRPIASHYVNTVDNTGTTLAQDAIAGSYQIRIVNAANWVASANHGVAFKVDNTGSYSDLPNHLVTMGISSIQQDGSEWIITLTRPIAWNMNAGTQVREHLYGPSYVYVKSLDALPEQWTKMSGTVSGMSTNKIEWGKWWPGTVYAQILILGNYTQTNNSKLCVDDMVLIYSE
jgi:hypothetical protein